MIKFISTLYIIVGYGTKISEVAHNVQAKVKYVLEQTLGDEADSVNIFVQSVRVTNPVSRGGNSVSITVIGWKSFCRNDFPMGQTICPEMQNIVDSLNVFPVPDGDTGTNMNLSI